MRRSPYFLLSYTHRCGEGLIMSTLPNYTIPYAQHQSAVTNGNRTGSLKVDGFAPVLNCSTNLSVASNDIN